MKYADLPHAVAARIRIRRRPSGRDASNKLCVAPLHCLRAQLFAVSNPKASAPPLILPRWNTARQFHLTVVPKAGGIPHPIETVNQLLPGDTITYRPLAIDSVQKKKVRIALLLVPSDGSKITVFDAKPGDESATWTVPFRAELASIVWGPEGLDKSKVNDSVVKDGELIAQLADYAAKSAETQALDRSAHAQRSRCSILNKADAASRIPPLVPGRVIDRTQPTRCAARHSSPRRESIACGVNFWRRSWQRTGNGNRDLPPRADFLLAGVPDWRQSWQRAREPARRYFPTPSSFRRLRTAQCGCIVRGCESCFRFDEFMRQPRARARAHRACCLPLGRAALS